MTTVWITRIAYTPHGTFGILEVNNFRCYTLERPYDGNLPYKSCIPTGGYTMKRGTFAAGGGYINYEIDYVEGRSNIEIHIGNSITNTKGCILLGAGLSNNGSLLGISDSKKAFDKFIHSMGGQKQARLEINNAVQILDWDCNVL
jgi:hypothetical protein